MCMYPIIILFSKWRNGNVAYIEMSDFSKESLSFWVRHSNSLLFHEAITALLFTGMRERGGWGGGGTCRGHLYFWEETSVCQHLPAVVYKYIVKWLVNEPRAVSQRRWGPSSLFSSRRTSFHPEGVPSGGRPDGWKGTLHAVNTT